MPLINKRRGQSGDSVAVTAQSAITLFSDRQSGQDMKTPRFTGKHPCMKFVLRFRYPALVVSARFSSTAGYEVI